MATMASDQPLALSNRFWVKADAPSSIDLGSWAKVDGLDVTFDVVEYRAGDSWNERWYSPGMTKYSTVKLTRTVAKGDSAEVQKWLNITARSHKPGLVNIELRDASDTAVAEWTLRSAMPTKWSVTSFDASTSKVATETLEIVHQGFLDD